MSLSEAQVRRYSRQMILPEVGGAGQTRLSRARILVIGAGGLGSPAALYLAGAGIGTLGIVDGDVVELSNLQRQILHDVKALGGSKVDAAQARLEALNPELRVVPYRIRLGDGNARDVIAGYDVVVEGSDNQATKLRVNDACVALAIPLVVAGVAGWDGQLLVVRPGATACYRCVCRAEPPAGVVPSCEAAGILGPVAGVVGSLQAVEALKLCLGLPGDLAGRLVLYDGMAGQLSAVRVRRDLSCPACGRASREDR